MEARSHSRNNNPNFALSVVETAKTANFESKINKYPSFPLIYNCLNPPISISITDLMDNESKAATIAENLVSSKFWGINERIGSPSIELINARFISRLFVNNLLKIFSISSKKLLSSLIINHIA